MGNVKKRSASQASKGVEEAIDDLLREGVLGTKNRTIFQYFQNQLLNVIWRTSHDTTETIFEKSLPLIAVAQKLAPADEAEAMLALQMVATHDAALECLRRASLPNQTFEGRDQNLKHGQKLMALYAQQLAAMDKHRGKGQQKVTVEHVHVAAGGQAIVGQVDVGAEKPAKSTSAAIEHQPGETVDMDLAASKGDKARRRSRQS